MRRFSVQTYPTLNRDSPLRVSLSRPAQAHTHTAAADIPTVTDRWRNMGMKAGKVALQLRRGTETVKSSKMTAEA